MAMLSQIFSVLFQKNTLCIIQLGDKTGFIYSMKLVYGCFFT